MRYLPGEAPGHTGTVLYSNSRRAMVDTDGRCDTEDDDIEQEEPVAEPNEEDPWVDVDNDDLLDDEEIDYGYLGDQLVPEDKETETDTEEMEEEGDGDLADDDDKDNEGFAQY